MKLRAQFVIWQVLMLASVAIASASDAVAEAPKRAVLDEEGVYQVPAFALPPSMYSSDEVRNQLIKRGKEAANAQKAGSPPASLDWFTKEGILKIRQQSDTARKAIAEQMQQVFPVVVTPIVIAGVQTDVVVPKDGVAAKNKKRVLINLHGGGFVFGARYEGQVASIPIASLGGIKVITVDYRMGPEHHFPAASEDVAKVYQELLKEYSPRNIGIYGHSAGAMLAAQSIAWFQSHALPLPGAIGLDGCGAASLNGDSSYFGGAFMFGVPPYPASERDNLPKFADFYYAGADQKSALVSPAMHPEVLRHFPPTLVMNAMRDPTLSGALFTHKELVRLGVDADLHVWDGVGHSFHYDHTLPESRESYAVLIKFFDKRLGP